MDRFCLLLLLAVVLSCETASGPTVSIDREALATVRRVAILPIANATGYDMVNPMVERLFLTELTNLRKFEFVNPTEVAAALESLKLTEGDLGNPFHVKTLGQYLKADAVIGAVITTYSPFGTEAALLGRDTKTAEKDIKPPKGIIGWLVPTKVSTSETNYEYGTVTKEPAIGAVVAMISTVDARVIYEASKLIQRDARVPGTYNMKYGSVLTDDELRRLDFIARLVIREMLDPLRRTT